jgi:hypothetical protein
MKNFDTVIDRQSIRGLGGVEVARMIGMKKRPKGLPRIDDRMLRDIGLDRGKC